MMVGIAETVDVGVGAEVKVGIIPRICSGSIMVKTIEDKLSR